MVNPPDQQPTLGEIARAVTRIEGDNRAIRERNHGLESSLTTIAIEQGRQGERIAGLQDDTERIENAQIFVRNLVGGALVGLLVNLILSVIVLVTRGG